MKHKIKIRAGILNTRDVFLQHIETIRQFSGAEVINVYHSRIHPSMSKMVVGNEAYTPSSFLDHPSTLIEQKDYHSTCFNDIKFAVHENIHLIIKLNDNPSIEVFEHHQTTASSNQSRRAPIETFKENSWYWMSISFRDRLPSWLGDSREWSSEDNSSQLSTLLQLLLSASLQLTLASNHLSLLSDPLTQLCSRKIMLSKLAMIGKQHSVGLIMLHCIDFQKINKKFGHEHGDRIILDIAAQLEAITREEDIIGRFGGALFGVAFPANAQTNVSKLASKLQQSLQSRNYLEGAIQLTFDIGAAIVKHEEQYNSDDDRAVSVINLADQALKVAQQEEAPSIIVWQNEDLRLYQPSFQYSGGIFTADTITDYRNMLLLWDISGIIADKNDFSLLLKSSIQRLAQTFDFYYAGLLVDDDTDTQPLQFLVDELDRVSPITSPDDQLTQALKRLQSDVLAQNKPLNHNVGDSLLLVLPLDAEESTDCFFIVGHSKNFDVAFDTKTLLSGLTKQIGKALRRSRLEQELNRELANKNAQLESELVQLKEGLQVSSIVYQSPVMQDLMKYTQRAAVTDTTVLITGESGTGKEKLLHAQHQLGPRNQKPLIIVDCGSIPETLIESELFGYVKGAFTGAQHSSPGKISEADGGILVLDEIGELPIQMQSKLLRFVQEKHFTPVGGNKVINVDLKIVAATNRDLAREVQEGTFRKDLYYRLNVLTLHIPPLRERIEDIHLLSNHFLNKFAEQFSLQKKKLSKEALMKMQHYSWPGNIRELENRLMQATLIVEGTQIDWSSMNIEDTPYNGTEELNSLIVGNTINHIAPTPIEIEQRAIPQSQSFASLEKGNIRVKDPGQTALDYPKYLAELQSSLVKTLHEIQSDSTFFNTPFGSWVEDEFIMQAFLANNKNMRKASARLCISLSTSRRRIEKLNNVRAQGTVKRPLNWPHLIEALKPFAKGDVIFTRGIADLKLVSLQVILNSSMPSMSSAANILGVSEPTFYKLKRELEKSAFQNVIESA